MALKKQFRAKQPPPEVVAPRYDSIMQRNEQRRAQVKAQSIQILKEKEKPFSFYQRDLEKHKQKLES